MSVLQPCWVLGTAKIGIGSYGYSSGGKYNPSLETLLNKANELGFLGIDTAESYGNAHAILGTVFCKGERNFGVIDTKMSAETLARVANKSLSSIDVVNNFLVTLNVSSIRTLYLHSEDEKYFSNPRLIEELVTLKNMGLIQRIGVSAYSADKIRAISRLGVYDVIQVPVNVGDIRAYQTASEVFSGQIVARSIFLQGTLLCSTELLDRHRFGKEICSFRCHLDRISRNCGITTREMMVAFVARLVGGREVIISSSTAEGLVNICVAARCPISIDTFDRLKDLALTEKEWTDPRTW